MLAMGTKDFLSVNENTHNILLSELEAARLALKCLESLSAYPVGKYTLRIKNSLSRDEMLERVRDFNTFYTGKFGKKAILSV